jgi:hypothetical protein
MQIELQNHMSLRDLAFVFLLLKPLDDRAFWRRCVEQPQQQRDSRALLTLKVKEVKVGAWDSFYCKLSKRSILDN